MDNRNIEHKGNRPHWGGVVLIVIGLFLFLQNLHLAVPYWVFSWKMLLIVVGLLFAIKHRFRGGPWFVMVLVGGIFLAEDILPWPINLPRYGWPLVLVIVGIFILTKRPHVRAAKEESRKRWAEKWEAASYQSAIMSATGEDYVSASAIFGGTDRVVLSKNFQGGDITAVFGGSEINLIQADFNGTVILEANAIFGGIELIIPSNWEVKLEVNTVFGGVDDKRQVDQMTHNTGKMLILRGSCIFGGIDIKSY